MLIVPLTVSAGPAKMTTLSRGAHRADPRSREALEVGDEVDVRREVLDRELAGVAVDHAAQHARGTQVPEARRATPGSAARAAIRCTRTRGSRRSTARRSHRGCRWRGTACSRPYPSTGTSSGFSAPSVSSVSWRASAPKIQLVRLQDRAERAVRRQDRRVHADVDEALVARRLRQELDREALRRPAAPRRSQLHGLTVPVALAPEIDQRVPPRSGRACRGRERRRG